MGASHPSILTYNLNLTTVYCQDSRNWAKVLPLMESIVRERAEVLGEEHRETLNSRGDLTVLFHNMGQTKEGVPLQKEVLRTQAKVLGELHPDIMISAQDLALVYMRLDRCREAIDLLHDVYRPQTEIHVLDSAISIGES